MRITLRRRAIMQAGTAAAILALASGSIAMAQTTRFRLSITPTPKTWTGPDMRLAFATAANAGSLICLADPVDWWKAEGKSAHQSKPYQDSRWQTVLMNEHHLKTFIQIDTYRPHLFAKTASHAFLRETSFADERVRGAVIADAVQRVERYQPEYLCLGMEINSYYEMRHDDFDAFVSLFAEASRAVKKIRPDVIVFASFQYEELLGVLGGVDGRPAHGPRWELLEKLDPYQDVVGISSYPLKTLSPPRYAPPDELPADYYTRLRAHTTKPIVFAELGWPSDPAFGGSPQKQAAFLKRLPSLLAGLDVRMINWNFLFDVKGFGPVFESMGFFDSDGKPKPAWEKWKKLGGSRP